VYYLGEKYAILSKLLFLGQNGTSSSHRTINQKMYIPTNHVLNKLRKCESINHPASDNLPRQTLAAEQL